MNGDLHIDTVWRGTSHQLGATWDGHGVNFALFSEHAEQVELCLFDAPRAVSGNASSFRRRPTTSGTVICRRPDLACRMATA